MWTEAITYVTPIIVGVFGGVWLDKWLGTKPWLTLICLAWGIATTMYMLIRSGKKQK